MTDIEYMYAQTKNSSNYLVLDSDNVEVSNNLLVNGDVSCNDISCNSISINGLSPFIPAYA